MPGRPKSRERRQHQAIEQGVEGPVLYSAEPNGAMRAGEVLQAIEGELIEASPDNPPPPRNPAESFARLEQRGLEEVLALIAEGLTQKEICERIGVRPAHMHSWIDSQQAGSRVRAAKAAGAQAWLDRGFAAIDGAQTLAELAKAREIAQMCRKYAQVMNPREFSDRVQVDATIEQVDDAAAIDAKMRLLMASIEGK